MPSRSGAFLWRLSPKAGRVEEGVGRYRVSHNAQSIARDEGGGEEGGGERWWGLVCTRESAGKIGAQGFSAGRVLQQTQHAHTMGLPAVETAAEAALGAAHRSSQCAAR